MSAVQLIYIEKKVSPRRLQMLMEKVLAISMIESDLPDGFFYYDDEKIGISVGLRQSLNPEYFSNACDHPVKAEMKIVFRSPINYIAVTDIAAVKCVNAILQEFDTDLLYIFEDDTPRLVKCQGKIFINWDETSAETNFWNRPGTSIIDHLIVPYKKRVLTPVIGDP